ncbi:MAG: sugar ABC transporter permease [Caldilineaceae bacterium]|nr:sugar ABC transporter permease [Caldilineaceae bacterium]
MQSTQTSVSAQPPRSQFRFTSQARAAWLFMLPSLTILAFFIVLPIFQAAWMALHDWTLADLNPTFIGLKNFADLFKDDRFWNALQNTLVYTIGVVPGQIILALVFALILNARLKGRTVFRGIYFLPVLVSFAVEAIVWRFLLDPDIGYIGYYSSVLGLPRIEWLRSPDWAMTAVILISIWRWFGFNLVILLAGLQGISESYYEAAEVDGANEVQKFRFITLPLLRPSLLFALINAVISALQAFDQIYVLTRGGPMFSTETVVVYVYREGFINFDMGYASTAALVLFGIIFVITLGQLRILRYQESF